MDAAEENKQLRARIAELEAQLQASSVSSSATHRARMDMISDVRDDNPYSRLMALQQMGIVHNYRHIREVSVAVIGVGGVGSVVAEMLCRCGVGRLILFDYDKVEMANMNRLFFRPDQTGLSKVDAARNTLADINPDVDIETHNFDITSVRNYETFSDALTHGSVRRSHPSAVNLVLCCVDNYAARVTVNRACLELNLVWMESGVSEDAVSGHIQLLVPGQLACFECVPPLVVAEQGDERKLRMGAVCAASLPTTMGIVAGLLVQNALKFVLGFGAVSHFVGYSAMTDFFPTYTLKASPTCVNELCRKRQVEAAARPAPLSQPASTTGSSASHAVADDPQEPNEWNLQVVADSEHESQHADRHELGSTMMPGKGVRHKFPQRQSDVPKNFVAVDEDSSLEQLQAALHQSASDRQG
jgi:ubiquitin-like modifier-activating enzyme 5